MPLADCIAEVKDILMSQPDANEVVVKQCKMFRNASETGNFGMALKMVNSMFDSYGPTEPVGNLASCN